MEASTNESSGVNSGYMLEEELRREEQEAGGSSRKVSGKVSPVGFERRKRSRPPRVSRPPDSHSCRNEKWRRTTKSTV